MIAVVQTPVEGVLHVILPPLLDVTASGVPEPREAVLGPIVPLSPKVAVSYNHLTLPKNKTI